METKIWYIVVKGKPEGPFDPDEIRTKLAKNEITPADLVFRPGFSRWLPLIEVREFDRRNLEKDPSTAAAFQVPHDLKQVPSRDGVFGATTGWVLLVKHETKDGKHHYIESGPYSTAEVQDKLRRQDIKLDDHLWKPGLTQWTPIHQLSEFDRRSRKEAHPIPSGVSAPSMTARASSDREEPTIVMASIPNDVPTTLPTYTKPSSPFDPDATVVQGAGFDREEATVIQNAMPPSRMTMEEMTEEESGEFHGGLTLQAKALYEKIKPPFKRKVIIATGGAILAMVFTYAGLRAYKQHGHFAEHPAPPIAQRPVTARPPLLPIAPLPQAPTQQNTAMNPPGAPVAMQPQPQPMTRPTPWPFTLRATPAQNQVYVSVTGPFEANDEVTMILKADPGSVPGVMSYELQKPMVVIGPKMEWPLSANVLRPGRWTIEARYRTMSRIAHFTYMTQTPQYARAIKTFRKTYVKEKTGEEKELLSHFQETKKWLAQLERDFKGLLSHPTPNLQVDWRTKYGAFRKWEKSAHSTLRGVTLQRKTAFVYPDALMSFKSLLEKVNDTASAMNRRLKARRNVASFDDLVETSLSATRAQFEYVTDQLHESGLMEKPRSHAKHRGSH